MAFIENGLVQIKSKLNRLYLALETGKVDIDDLGPGIKELRNQQNDLENERDVLSNTMDRPTY